MPRRQASIEWHRAYRDGKRKAGICPYCKEPAAPNKVVCLTHLEERRQRSLQEHRDRYRDADRRATHMLTSAKARANRDGVQCSLTTAWILARIESGNCAVTGLPFDLSKHPKWKTHPYAPSIDRVKAGADYSEENCRVVILAVNAAMNEWGEDVFRTVASAYMARTNAL